MKPKEEYWLIPWGIGYECRTEKPDGYSFQVIDYDEVVSLIEKLEAGFRDIRKYSLGSKADTCDASLKAIAKWKEHVGGS